MTNNKVNPWSVENIDEFLQYCCPECDVKYQAKERFVLHAFEKHPMAKDCLELRLDSENVTVVCKNQNEQSVSLKLEEVVIQGDYFKTGHKLFDRIVNVNFEKKNFHSSKSKRLYLSKMIYYFIVLIA